MSIDNNGRPSKYTEDTINSLVEAFHDDATIVQACQIAEISPETYYTWLKEKDGFSDKMDRAQEYPKVVAKHVIVKAIHAGDEKMALEFIKRREKDRYSERHDMTTNGKDFPTPLLTGVIDVSKHNSSSEAK